MDSLTIAGIVFACTFGGAMLGIYIRRFLPESHLNSDSKEIVKTGTGLIATLSALVLGLLVASAKSSYDAQKAGFQQLSTNLILLDRSLKFYGEGAEKPREHLSQLVKLLLDHKWPEDGSKSRSLDAPEISAKGAAFYMSIRDLPAQSDAQKSIQSQALQVSMDLGRTRWNLTQAEERSIPNPFLFILIFWLTVLFVSFGLFSPCNGTVISILLICALSVAAALFLIVELDRPFNGLIQIPSKPLRDAYGQLGQ